MVQLSQLLLFDSNPSGLDTLTYGFEKSGCSVAGTSDPAKARDLIQIGGATLLLVGVHQSNDGGIELIRFVNGNPRTRNFPCVAFGPANLRADALAAGAFTFLTIPVFVRDILGASKLVAAATVPGSRPSPDTEISLSADDIEGVYHLVRIFAVSGRSALVDVQRDGKRGELRFVDGSLTSIQYGSIHGLPALHQLLLWDRADLRFKFKNVVKRGTQISLKPAELLEECDRFMRDFAHEVEPLGHARTIYATNSARRPAPHMPGEVVPILKKFDGKNDLARVLADSPFGIFDTLRIVKRFLSDDAIVESSPRSKGAPSLQAVRLEGPAALNPWFQRQTHGGETDNSLGKVGLGLAQAGAALNEAGRPTASASVGTAPYAGHGKPDLARNKAATPSPALKAVNGAPKNLRERTATKREYGETLKEALARNNQRTPAPVSVADIPTPPPLAPVETQKPLLSVIIAASVTAPSEPEAISAKAAAPALVAQGEIRSRNGGTRQTGSMPAAGSPSIMVDFQVSG